MEGDGDGAHTQTFVVFGVRSQRCLSRLNRWNETREKKSPLRTRQELGNFRPLSRAVSFSDSDLTSLECLTWQHKGIEFKLGAHWLLHTQHWPLMCLWAVQGGDRLDLRNMIPHHVCVRGGISLFLVESVFSFFTYCIFFFFLVPSYILRAPTSGEQYGPRVWPCDQLVTCPGCSHDSSPCDSWERLHRPCDPELGKKPRWKTDGWSLQSNTGNIRRPHWKCVAHRSRSFVRNNVCVTSERQHPGQPSIHPSTSVATRAAPRLTACCCRLAAAVLGRRRGHNLSTTLFVTRQHKETRPIFTVSWTI